MFMQGYVQFGPSGAIILCGVNGVFAYHYAANAIDAAELIRTRDYMAARGPDAASSWVSEDQRIGFGHRRLAIIDLSKTGAQPMASPDGRFVVTFNGEIYNYQELRRSLQEQGRVFRSHSDTEVLLHLYAVKGPEMVHDLRGMFAFAIWDGSARTLLLARDPYGIKPLYYADDGWTFRFASQVKALRAGGAISNEPDPGGYVGFYLFGSVPEPFTIYREIRALPAGSTLIVDRIGARPPKQYHSVARVFCDAEALAKEACHDRVVQTFALREALLDSVRHHLVADVPVGAFLSSGIDSCSLVGLMRDAGQQDIQTVTLSFEEFRGRPQDEAPLAEEIARTLNTRHTTRVVTEAEFAADFPRIMDAMDQPSIDGINTWFVSKAAHEVGLKVAVSGLGGDELFGGYPSFTDIPKWVRRLRLLGNVPVLGRFSRILGRPLVRLFGANPKAAGLLEYGGSYAGGYLLRRGLFMPWELGDILDRDFLETGLRRLSVLALIENELRPCPAHPSARVSTLESALYMKNQLLRDTDWASMAHSLEVRTPFVDSRLLAMVATLTADSRLGPSKALLAEAPSQPLPEAIRQRRKTGFTTPVASWQQRELAKLLKGDSQTHSTGPWARQWAGIVMATVTTAKARLAA